MLETRFCNFTISKSMATDYLRSMPCGQNIDDAGKRENGSLFLLECAMDLEMLIEMKTWSKMLLLALRRYLLWVFFISSLPSGLSAQYFVESFDDIDSIWSRGWTQQNRSTPIGGTPNWFQGDPGIFATQAI